MISHLPKSTALAVAAAALAGMLLHAGTAATAAGVNARTLTCRVAPGSGDSWIVYSSPNVDCVFNTPRGQERHAGRTGIGLGANLTLLNPFLTISARRFTVVATSGTARFAFRVAHGETHDAGSAWHACRIQVAYRNASIVYKTRVPELASDRITARGQIPASRRSPNE